jgi:hypothetical protein
MAVATNIFTPHVQRPSVRWTTLASKHGERSVSIYRVVLVSNLSLHRE